MKKIILSILTHLLSLCFINVYSQNITVPEPEFLNSAVYVEDNQSQRLEKSIPHDLSRRTIASYATGVYASKQFKQVRGNASDVRLPLKDSYTFIVRVISNAYDPFEEIAILRLESSRDNRKYTASSFDMLGQSKSGDLNYIPFDGRKYGESSYLIQISQPLEPGEYAIQLRRASDVLNCFGVGEIGYEEPQEETLNYEEAKAREKKAQKPSSFSGYQALVGGDFAAHAGFGIGIFGFPLLIGGDYMITDDIGVGAEFQYASWEQEYYSSFYGSSYVDWTATLFGIRGTYHLMNAFDIANPQLDMYGGILLGFANAKRKDSDGDFGDESVPGFAFFAGGRYMFNENIGIMGELGYGLVILKTGLTIKF